VVDLRLSFYGFEEKWAIPKTIGFQGPKPPKTWISHGFLLFFSLQFLT